MPPGASGATSGPGCGEGDLDRAELSGLCLRHRWTRQLRGPGGAGGTWGGSGQPRPAGELVSGGERVPGRNCVRMHVCD